ncbi:MAG TPA: beta-eliminating lyase-related protein [Bauldia sp.]|nr:beta-eliminating lyase-related protein [Bauldia sp.]
MIFASDNWAGASDKVMTALTAAARSTRPAYGGDDLSRAVERGFAELFEREVAVFLVGTGTAANTLGIANYARPGGVVFCHRDAHINVDEAGASEFFGGTKLVAVEGRHGKYTAEALAEAVARFPQGAVHHGRPVVASISEITEFGTAYRPEEIAAIAAVAKRNGMALHMDGARFAGAVAGLGVAPADLTWRAGVDVMSFGASKTGCLAAEAVIFFNPADSRDFGFARQRAGHGFSKAWFIAAQFDAWLDGGHWLDLARHANRMGARLAQAIGASRNARLAAEPSANEVFAILPRSLDAKLKAAGAVYHPWGIESLPEDERPGPDEVLVRLVASFQTREDEVDDFAAHLARG